jgi:hypothetical protein
MSTTRCRVNDDDDDALFIAFVPSVINPSSPTISASPRHPRRSTFRTLGSEPSPFHSPSVSRMLAVASSALPWNWSSLYEHESGPSDPKNHPIRTRAEQLAARTDGCPGTCRQVVAHFEHSQPPDVEESKSFYPGLVNISGTYCFMNSTMQVREPRCPTLPSPFR